LNFEKQAQAALINSQKSKQKGRILVNHVKFNDYKTQEERRKVYQQVVAIRIRMCSKLPDL
jgi:ribosomal protein S9